MHHEEQGSCMEEHSIDFKHKSCGTHDHTYLQRHSECKDDDDTQMMNNDLNPFTRTIQHHVASIKQKVAN